MMISQELLSIIYNTDKIKEFSNTHITLWNPVLHNWSTHEDGRWETTEINIYELAHKCKEWALTKGYMLSSLKGSTFGRCAIVRNVTDVHYEFDILDDSEPQAIFKACQWILER